MSPAPAPSGRPREAAPSSPPDLVRVATLGDLDSLLSLELRCFTGDRLSRRSFRSLLASDTSATLVAEHGYLLLLLRRRSKLARIYSVAVAPEARGRGLGRRLVEVGEQLARAREREVMQLEVRTDNDAAIRLYESLGYQSIGRIEDYYEDGCEALRYRKSLTTPETPPMENHS